MNETNAFEELIVIKCGDGTIYRQRTLVRCKDCKYWYFADNRIPCERENVCGRNGIVVAPEWFCADAERKDDDD